MIAIIKNKDIEYRSVVVAMREDGMGSYVVAFDKNKDTLAVIPVWESERRPDATGRKVNYLNRAVFIIDAQTEGWIKNGKLSSVAEIAKSSKALDAIKRGKCSEELLEKAKAMQSGVENDQWFPLSDEKHAANFNKLTFFLHDAIIMKIEDGDDYKDVYIDTSWQCVVVMRCRHVRKCNLEIGMIIIDDEDYFDFEEPNKAVFKPKFYTFNMNNDIIEGTRIECEKIEYSVIVNDEEIEKLQKEYRESVTE